jgi:NAD(P)H-hydrate epimerase
MQPDFRTINGLTIPGVTENQMREVDRIAIEETGPNLFQMMENAGRNLALQAIEMTGRSWQGERILVLTGGGGNGGGGICAARHLANRGANVGLVIADPDRVSDVTAWQQRVFSSTSGEVVSIDQLTSERPGLIVDALIGYSLHGAPQGTIETLIRWASGANAPILALDIPSGVDASTGTTPGVFVTATLTMTLALPKFGLVNPAAGKLVLADIGIPIETFRRAHIEYQIPFDHCYRIAIQRGHVPT